MNLNNSEKTKEIKKMICLLSASTQNNEELNLIAT